MSRKDRRKDLEHKNASKEHSVHRQDAYAAVGERRQEIFATATIGIAAAAAITVWAAYYPADSTAVEQGHALGLTCSLMVWVLATAMGLRFRPAIDVRQASWWVDVSALGLAAWVFFAAWVTAGIFSASPPDIGGDLRAATNEAWWWIAAAGFFVVVRQLMSNTDRVRAVFGLMLGLGTLLAVHTLHQNFVSLPETMREYLRDPDGTLAMIGLNAPSGSAARMIYENRLRDGGPTATFALANSLAGPLAMIATLCGGCLMCLLARIQSDCRSWTGSHEKVEDGGHGEDAAFAERKATILIAMLSVVLCLLIVALWTTGSRSGVLSVAIVGLAFAVSSVWTRTGRPIRAVLASLIGLGFAAVVVWWRSGAESRIGHLAEGSRATIELRLQYWRSTLAMALDHPWFGSGPGNFQLDYQKYRDVHAHEMIAEPHNFIFETLACGGWIAIVLLTVCLIAGCVVYRRTLSLLTEPELARRSPFVEQGHDSVVGIAVAVGAFVGLLAVWYYGIFGDALPDFEAHLYAIPVAIVVMGIWWMANPSRAMGFNNRQCRRIAAAAAVCGFIHLCFSGGWTIPGVSIVLTWFAGIATSQPSNIQAANREAESRGVLGKKPWISRLIIGLIWGALILFMVFFSWRPVMRTRAAMADATTQLNTRRIASAEATLRSALQGDPLAKDAAIWVAEIENRKWMLSLASPESDSSRQSRAADKAVTESITRAGNNPTLLRAIGELLVQRYQVGGRTDDLAKANEIFSKAIALSPTQESIVAQQSEIIRELTVRGVQVNGDSAAQLAARAEELAVSGGMVTRELELQPILPARKIGLAALDSPVRAAASELLRGQPDSPK